MHPASRTSGALEHTFKMGHKGDFDTRHERREEMRERVEAFLASHAEMATQMGLNRLLRESDHT